MTEWGPVVQKLVLIFRTIVLVANVAGDKAQMPRQPSPNFFCSLADIVDIGDLPYDLAQPFLPFTSARQLFQLEESSPVRHIINHCIQADATPQNLLNHDDQIWRGHAIRDFYWISDAFGPDAENRLREPACWRQCYVNEAEAQDRRRAQATERLRGQMISISEEKARNSLVVLDREPKSRRKMAFDGEPTD